VDELTQPWVGRWAELDDWIADAVGTAAGILPVLIVQRVLDVPARARRQCRAG
jgi:VanZ family protein